VVVARAVGTPEEALTVSTLHAVDAGAVDMRTLVIVGSSTTRTMATGNGHRRVYTPRRYPATA
jgi:precorrin-2 C20-methyltransferase / precorrin-3B C17-methyltransferase